MPHDIQVTISPVERGDHDDDDSISDDNSHSPPQSISASIFETKPVSPPDPVKFNGMYMHVQHRPAVIALLSLYYRCNLTRVI